MSTIDGIFSYSDLIESVKGPYTDDEKVRKNSRDDFGVGPGYYFHFLQGPVSRFRYYYAKPSELCESHLFFRNIGAVKYIPGNKRGNGKPAIVVSCDRMISDCIFELSDMIASFEEV